MTGYEKYTEQRFTKKVYKMFLTQKCEDFKRTFRNMLLLSKPKLANVLHLLSLNI